MAAVGTAMLGLIATASLAGAAEPSRFVSELIGARPGEGKTFACFTRVYDAAHLAAHPEQNVTAAEMLVVAYSSLDYAYQLRMGFRFRDHPQWLTTVAECGRTAGSRGGGAVCAGPSDGGHMRLVLEGRRTVLITLPEGAALWKGGPPNPDDTVDDAFHADDRVFRLERVPLGRCDDQAIDGEERALLDRDR
jgi:hypothetical protein